MNQLQATIIEINNVESLHSLLLNFGKQNIHILTLELDPKLTIGSVVKLRVKSTDIAIAKDILGLLSFDNQLDAKITAINSGQILSSIRIHIEGFELESIISKEASYCMRLEVGDTIKVLIQASEISIC